MEQSSFIRAGHYRSPLRVVAGMLLRSRETQAKRARYKAEEIKRLSQVIEQQHTELEKAREELAELKQRNIQLESENNRLRNQPPVLPHDPVLRGHEFGPKMISVCVNLAMKVGLRASITCMEIVKEWLRVNVRLPVWTTVRTWLMRLGVAALQAPVEEADDWIWMADHSNQIGQEKALAVIGIRASKMPPPGVAIGHQDVRLLMLEPGVQWKTADMANAYERLAEKAGNPLAVVTDGACELRDGAEILQKRGENTLLLRDFKHFAANVLKSEIGNDKRFTKFTAHVGRT